MLNQFSVKRDVCKAIIQAIVLAVLTVFAGVYLIITYGTRMLEKSGTHVPVETATIIFGVTQLLGTYIAIHYVDKKGRKFLLLLSMVGCASNLLALTIFLYLQSNSVDFALFHWIPVICMALVVIFSTCGIFPLRSVCLVESFSPKLRSFGVSFGNVVVNLCAFISVKIFPILMESIRLEGCLLILAVGCVFGLFYIILFVEETKGKNLNVVRKEEPTKEETV